MKNINFFKIWFIVFLLCFLITDLFSQSVPLKQWDKRFGGDSIDFLTTIQQTTDGGYILGGASYSDSSGDRTQGSRGSADYWVVKTDANGVKQWDKRFGGDAEDDLFSLQQTKDGGYILGGWSYSNVSGDKTDYSRGINDYWVIKIDVNGNKIWDKDFGGYNPESLTSIQQTKDGGYILGGISSSDKSGDKTENSQGSNDYWIIKIDSNGVKQWDKDFGGTSAEFLYFVAQTKDGGYILGGYSDSDSSGDKTKNSKGKEDYWIVKTDSVGQKQWDKNFGGKDNDRLYSIKQTTDGGYILGGVTQSEIGDDISENSRGLEDYWIVKTDANGVKQWDKRFGGNANDYGRYIRQTKDGGYIIVGYSQSGISGDRTEASQGLNDYWIVKTDANGIKQWDKRFGGDADDYGRVIEQTNDNEYILGGYSASGKSGDKTQNSRGSIDCWIIKLSTDILPVTLLNFDGTIQNNNAILDWSTVNEINNKGFEVQKSFDGSTFYTLCFVKGNETSSIKNNYDYTDIKVLSGLNYYRLKQIDFDGKFSYSPVIKLNYSKFNWNIQGNPIDKNSWIQLQLDKRSSVSIQLVSMNGKILQTINKGDLNQGTYSIPLNLVKVTSGIYIIKLIHDNEMDSKKIMKK